MNLETCQSLISSIGLSVPVAGCPDPGLSVSPCMARHPCCASVRRFCPVVWDPDPCAGSRDVVTSDPDVVFARRSRAGDKRCRRGGRRRRVDFDFLDFDGGGPAGDNDAAGCKDRGEKVRDIQ